MKSISRGYASFDYEVDDYHQSDLVRVNILVHGEQVDALAFLAHRSQAERRGRQICERLKDLIPSDSIPLRILKQDLFEMIISFIVSANNNIPRIKGIIDRMCIACGEKMGTYCAFPTAKALAEKDEIFFKEIGLGYRAPYILKTARLIANNNFDLIKLVSFDTESAKKMLLILPGVGPKVADCILLFGLNRYDVFPVDTWIEKVYKEIFNKDNTPQNMRKDLIKEFGKYSGIAQQYLFYAKRG